MTPANARRLGADANTACNGCGGKLVEALQAAMMQEPEVKASIVISPEAVEQIERQTGHSALEEFPNAQVKFESEIDRDYGEFFKRRP